MGDMMPCAYPEEQCTAKTTSQQPETGLFGLLPLSRAGEASVDDCAEEQR